MKIWPFDYYGSGIQEYAYFEFSGSMNEIRDLLRKHGLKKKIFRNRFGGNGLRVDYEFISGVRGETRTRLKIMADSQYLAKSVYLSLNSHITRNTSLFDCTVDNGLMEILENEHK